MALELGDAVRTHDGIDGEIVSLHEDGVAALVDINQNETAVGTINCDVDLLTLIEPPGTDPRSLPPLANPCQPVNPKSHIAELTQA